MDIKRPYKNNQTHGAHFGIFSGMALVSNGAENNRPPQAKAARGLMHHPAFVAVATTAEQAWRTVGLDIPCQVASPQSLTPFLQSVPRSSATAKDEADTSYQGISHHFNNHWPPELCLKNPCLRGLALWKVLFSRMNHFFENPKGGSE